MFLGDTAYSVFTELKSLKGFHWVLQNLSVLFLLGGIVGRLEFIYDNIYIQFNSV